MTKLRAITANLNFFFCCLLVFLLFFENSFSTPAWLQVVGRMHPLLLHFPIALLCVYALWALLKKKEPVAGSSLHADDLLLLGSLTASVSAIMGLALSKETGYSPESLFWHKWLGSFTAFGALAWYNWRSSINNTVVLRSTALTMIVLVVLAGHFGAGVTHGENFVLAPVTPAEEPKVVSLEEAVVFTHMVQPILEEKCLSCHNSRKAKGELVMESPETLLAGGKNGLLWDSVQSDKSLLLRRINLPQEAEEHMPPAGKAQLTDEEVEVLEAWIFSGASFDSQVASLAPESPLYTLAQAKLNTPKTKNYNFATADPETVAKLNSFYRSISSVSANSPALSVSFFSREAFSVEQLKELEPIKSQVVSLNLSKMPLGDADLQWVTQFQNLEKLNLNFTDITNVGLKSLASLGQLAEVSLSGTAISDEGLKELRSLEALRKLVLWNTGIDSATVAIVQADFPGTALELGFDPSGTTIQLPPPVIETTQAIFNEPLNVEVRHFIGDAVLRYTTDGSEPDSLLSPRYEAPIELTKSTELKIKAFKEGWFTSEVVARTFLRSSIAAQEVSLLTQPNDKYKSDLEETLVNGIRGTNNQLDGNWLGYQGDPMDVLITLPGGVSPSAVTLSCLHNTGGWIMPPARVEVWYGNTPDQLRLFSGNNVPQPEKHLPVGSGFYSYELPKESFTYLKLHIVPVQKLPQWHDAKGKPGWVFVDEILLN